MASNFNPLTVQPRVSLTDRHLQSSHLTRDGQWTV